MSNLNITPSTTGGGFTMNLTNGTIKVPDKQGFYVISTGCGSGKTQNSKSLIKQKFNEGILYCVDTNSELIKMYDWIKKEGFVDASDVQIITSDSAYRDELEKYWENPELLLKKKILLITHVRLWTDLINYFLVYNPNLSSMNPFDGDFQALMARDDLRKYIIIDETPHFIKPFATVPREILGVFSNLDNKTGKWMCRKKNEIANAYKTFVEGTDRDPFVKKGGKKSMKIKRDVILSLIPKYYNEWMQSPKKDECNITFNPFDLMQKEVKSHILVLEGAGDLLFGGSNKHFKLLNIQKKYNANVEFESYPFGLKRKGEDFIKDKNTGEQVFSAEFNEQFDAYKDWLTLKIKNNQASNKKTLIVVWKDYGKNNGKYRHKEDDKTFFNKVYDVLKSNNDLDSSYYHVIYYGSSESKSTNEYREYNEIILSGEWMLPNSETKKFNANFGVETSNENYCLWFYIQLICRIGIRNQDGKDYKVWYSDDFKRKRFFNELKDYFTNKQTNNNKSTPKKMFKSWLEERLKAVGFNKRHYEALNMLLKQDSNIEDKIKNGQPYSITITFNDMQKISPRKIRRKREYDSLVNELKKIQIILDVVMK